MTIILFIAFTGTLTRNPHLARLDEGKPAALACFVQGGFMTRPISCLRGARKGLQELAEFAIGQGWSVSRSRGGHVMFTKPGYPAIYTSSTASDHRAGLNARAALRRAQHSHQTGEAL